MNWNTTFSISSLLGLLWVMLGFIAGFLTKAIIDKMKISKPEEIIKRKASK